MNLRSQAAAYVYGLFRYPPANICVHVPHGSGLTPRAPWDFKHERAGVRRRTNESPPRIAVEDALLDLCAEGRESDVIDVVARAVQGRYTTVAALRRRLLERPRVSHRRLLTGLLCDVDEGTETFLEIAYLRDVERAHDLPRGTRQHRNAAGQVRDVRYDKFATVVELDGRLGHEGMGRFRDMDRDNYAVVSGEVTLRYGHFDVTQRSCPVAWQIASVLAGRGWSGIPRRCPRCRLVPDFGGI